MMDVDRSSPLPLYYQLKRILLHAVQRGDIAPGETLPSEKELEERYGISRITVRRALSELASDGYILRQPGRGTFVLHSKIEHRSEAIAGIRNDLANRGFTVESEILEHRRQPVCHQAARKLGLEEGHPILYVRRLVLVEGEPLLLTTGHHNLDEELTFTDEELASDSIFRLLQSKYGVVLSRMDRTIEATCALEQEAELLNVRPNGPMLLAELLVYDDQGRPISFMKNLYRGDRYRYRHSTQFQDTLT